VVQIINSRGYANITETGSDTDEVWGLIYELHLEDEARLDLNEGVPYAYEKRVIEVEFWKKGSIPVPGELPPSEEVVEMLVYIDFQRNSGEGNKPQDEYVHRMNEGIRDALKEGVPARYIDEVVRAYIPVEDEADERAKALALKQAVSFNDESGVFTRTGSGAGVGIAPASQWVPK
jgi:gamma-glutamylcyclotransferase